jgi:membrane protein implicated in regulation of membrane protease activity
MPALAQTIVALAIVAVAALLLVRSWLKKRAQPGCGGDCGAVSPEIKQLQAKLKR